MTEKAFPHPPPLARKLPKTVSMHGHSRVDDYAWLRADNWQQALKDPQLLPPPIREYLEAENAYVQAKMSDTKALQKDLFRELKGHIKPDDCSVPKRDGAFCYFGCYRKDQQYPIYYRFRAGNAASKQPRETLLDTNREAEGSQYFSLSDVLHSPDHKFIAFGTDRLGGESYRLEVRRVSDGKPVGRPIEHTSGNFVWSNNSQFLFYTALDDHYRPDRIKVHRLSDDPADDFELYKEQDPGFFVRVDKTCSRAFVTVEVTDHQSSEVWLAKPDVPTYPLQLIQKRTPDLEYFVEEHAGKLIIRTNIGENLDFCLVTAGVDEQSSANWETLYTPPAGNYLQDFIVHKDWIARVERENANPIITVMHMQGKTCVGEHRLAIRQPPPYELRLHGLYEYSTNSLYFDFTSMKQPTQTFDYRVDLRQKKLIKEVEVPSGYSPDDFKVERVWAPTEGQVEVPISLVYHRDTPINGGAPVILYGYGAYGHVVESNFSSHRIAMLKRGYIYAIAHIRGGRELGQKWYLAGKMANKPNTFKDFIACATALIHKKYTQKGRICIVGGSAGGMLIGASVNMRPDLFMSAVAHVPFVDVVNTMIDEDLPLTPPEWLEWGNPIRDPQAYHGMCAYSPYDNVKRQDYPHILITAGVSDPRVTYWEPAKWAASLRCHKTDNHLLLLKTNMSAGHGGASGRFNYLNELALEYAFILKSRSENNQ